MANIIKRIGIAAREARDVVTAYGTTLAANQDYRSGNPGDKGLQSLNVNRASKNMDKQIAEAAKAILKGKTGTSSDILDKYTDYKKGTKR